VRTAIGLIVLGLVAGVVPTGFGGIQYAAVIVACTFGALFSLLAACLIASLVRFSKPAAPAPQLAFRRAASTSTAPRTI